jgi:hypothetical protein
LLGACAPAPILRYASDDPADRWESGVRLHSARTGGALFISAFAGETMGEVPGRDGRALAFSLLARNESASDLRLDPSDFRLLAPRTGKAYPPADPEAALAIVDRDRREEIGRAAVQRNFRGLMAIPLLAGQVAALAGDARERAEVAKEYAESERAEAEEHALHQATLAELDDRRRPWAEDALRRTDLRAGKTLSGDLTFPFPDLPLPPDSVVLQWRGPGGGYLELGRYGRPVLAEDTAAPGRAYRSRGPASPYLGNNP